MKRALGELMVEGVKSTNALHLALVKDEGVRMGNYHTGYLENLARNVGSMPSEQEEGIVTALSPARTIY